MAKQSVTGSSSAEAPEDSTVIAATAQFRDALDRMELNTDAASQSGQPAEAKQWLRAEGAPVSIDGLFRGASILQVAPNAERRTCLATEEQLMGAALDLMSAAQERCSNGLSLAETTLMFHALNCVEALRKARESRV